MKTLTYLNTFVQRFMDKLPDLVFGSTHFPDNIVQAIKDSLLLIEQELLEDNCKLA